MSNYRSERYVTLVNDALTRVNEITPDELRGKLENDEPFELLDVREMHEWDKARIAGADYLGRGVIEREIETEAPDIHTEIVLYCSGDNRSALAADNLQKMGYRNVKTLRGGFRAWNEAGHPIEKEEA